MNLDIFPADIIASLKSSLHNLPASSCADEDLMRVLRNYDKKTDGALLVEELPDGALFALDDGKIFRKGPQLRKRFQCVEVKTGKLLLTLEDKAGGVRSVQFTPDGTRVILAGGDGTARILLASVDGLLGFGCRVLRGTDLYPEVTSYCDRFPDSK